MAFDLSTETFTCYSLEREGKYCSLSSIKSPSGRTTNLPQYRQLPSPSCAQTTLPQLRQLLMRSCFCVMQSHFTLFINTSFGLAFSFFIYYSSNYNQRLNTSGTVSTFLQRLLDNRKQYINNALRKGRGFLLRLQ